MRLCVLRVSAQQLQGMRQEFDYRFERLGRAAGASWQIQDQ